MGLDLYCRDKTFRTSYGHWCSIRINIIKATIDYIQEKIKNDQELYKNININEEDENWIGKGSVYYCYMSDINELIKYILINSPLPYIVEQNTASDDILIKFTRICQNSKYRNALNYFELGGLFALCNESDFEGYYTIGNSLDICVLFDRIKNHMKKYDGYNYIYIEEGMVSNTIYNVFETSYTTLKKVTIT
jgi:hypothetical protein